MKDADKISFLEWLSDYRNQNLILAGLRYSLGRSTYQCGDGCMVFEGLIPYLPNRVIAAAWNDCRWELFMYERTPQGFGREVCDIPYIQALLKRLDGEMDKRNLYKDMRTNEWEDEAVLDMRTLKVKRLSEGAALPGYSHKGDACFDFFLPADDVIPPCAVGYKVPLGIAVEIPKGYFLEILVRSSTGLKMPIRLANSVGIVDEGYRGELCLILDNLADEAVLLTKGQRIAQGMLCRKIPMEFEEVTELAESERGEGGFGSSGR